jgi:hypothetical protein
MNNAPERSFQDMKQWSNNLIGKIYYERANDDPRYFRTARVGWNGFANKIVLQYTPFIMGEPPAEMQQLNPRLRSSINTMQFNGNNSFY